MRQVLKKHMFLALLGALLLCPAQMYSTDAPREVRVHQEELAELTQASVKYVFVGAEASDILVTLQRVAQLAQPEDSVPACKLLNERLKKGYKTTTKENIVEVLRESEWLIEMRHNKCDDNDQLAEMIQAIDRWQSVIASDELTIGWADAPADVTRRAPRPGESTGVETEGVPSDAGTDVCCELPRDVYVERNLTVGGDLTVNGSIIIVGPVVLNSDLILQPLFPDNEICIIWLENAVNGGAEKARLCDSSIVGDKGLFISVDAGVTENFRVTNAGDVSLSNNLLLNDSTSAAVGNILKNGTITLHNFGGDADSSIYLGKSAGNLVTNTGTSNTAVGYLAMNAVTSGSGNVALGRSAMQNITTGIRNIAIGQNAGIGIISGSNNTIIGDSAGFLLSTGANNIYIGRGAAALSPLANNNSIVIQSQPTNAGTGSTADNQIRIGFGDTASTSTFIQGINTANIGAAANIVGVNASGQLGTIATNFIINGSVEITGDLTVDQSIYLPATTSAAVGNVYKAGLRFIHTAGGSTNVFIGSNAGNFGAIVGTDDIGIGNNALFTLSTGSANVALGSNALTALTTGSGNTALGTSAGAAVTNAIDNTLVGRSAGASLITGGSNVAVGRSALLSATSGAGNVAVGVQAGEDLTTANDNTLVGTQAGANLTTGASNVAVGRSALLAATTGQGNAILGFQAGIGITTANDNTVVGTQAGNALTTGGNNVAVGRRALFSSTTGTMNVAVGDQSGNNMTTGINNTLLGSAAGFSLTTGSNNIYAGINASSGVNFSNSIAIQSRPASGGTQVGANNEIRIGFGDTASTTTFIDGINGANIGATASFVGVNASGQLGTVATAFTISGSVTITSGDLTLSNGNINLTDSTSAATGNIFKGGVRFLNNAGGDLNSTFVGRSAGVFGNTGLGNSGFGSGALDALTSGSFNVAVGRDALGSLTTGQSNVAVGVQAGEDITSANDNTLVGTQAGANLTTGSSNVAVGRSTLLAATTGQGHAVLGFEAGISITTANDNTLVGTQAGNALTTGGNNTAIGRRALFSSTTGTMNVALGDVAGNSLTTATGNTLLGSGAGFTLTTGSSNIYAGINASSGVNFDNSIAIQARPASGGTQVSASNQIRIGFGDTASTTTFIDGISGAALGATADLVAVNASGQLGTSATTLTWTGNLSVTGTVTAGTGLTVTSGGETITSGDLTLSSGNINLPATASAAIGNVIKAGSRFLHAAGSTDNVFLGENSGNFVSITGDKNTGIGSGALENLTFGTLNTVVGYQGGRDIKEGSGNIFIGVRTGVGLLGAEFNNIYIGNDLSVPDDFNTIRIGFSGVHTAFYAAGIRNNIILGGDIVVIDVNDRLGIPVSSIRYKDNIVPLPSVTSQFMQLNPVSFTGKGEFQNVRDYGLIAEEVEPLFPDMVVYNKEGQVQSLHYCHLNAYFIKMIQDQQRSIEVLNELVATQQSLIEDLQQRVATLVAA